MGLFFFLGDIMFIELCSTEGTVLIKTETIQSVLKSVEAAGTTIIVANDVMWEVSESYDKVKKMILASLGFV